MNPTAAKRLVRLYTVQQMRPSRIALYLKIETAEVYAELIAAGIPLRGSGRGNCSTHYLSTHPIPIRDLPAIEPDPQYDPWEQPHQAEKWGSIIFPNFNIPSTAAPKTIPPRSDPQSHCSLLSNGKIASK